MRHYKFNNDEMNCYILQSRIQIRSGLCREVGFTSGPKPDRIRNTVPEFILFLLQVFDVPQFAVQNKLKFENLK
jgi:hypothetical protein